MKASNGPSFCNSKPLELGSLLLQQKPLNVRDVLPASPAAAGSWGLELAATAAPSQHLTVSPKYSFPITSQACCIVAVCNSVLISQSLQILVLCLPDN